MTHLSQNGYELYGRGSILGRSRASSFLPPSPPSSIGWGTTRKLFHRAKRPQREAHHSFPTSTEVENAQLHTSPPVVWCFFRNRCSFSSSDNLSLQFCVLSRGPVTKPHDAYSDCSQYHKNNVKLNIVCHVFSIKFDSYD